METRQLGKTSDLIKLAKERIQIPVNWREVKYFDDVDLLVIRYSLFPATHSKSDDLEGIVYNYDANDNLTSIEILDFYNVFVSL